MTRKLSGRLCNEAHTIETKTESLNRRLIPTYSRHTDKLVLILWTLIVCVRNECVNSSSAFFYWCALTQSLVRNGYEDRAILYIIFFFPRLILRNSWRIKRLIWSILQNIEKRFKRVFFPTLCRSLKFILFGYIVIVQLYTYFQWYCQCQAKTKCKTDSGLFCPTLLLIHQSHLIFALHRICVYAYRFFGIGSQLLCGFFGRLCFCINIRLSHHPLDDCCICISTKKNADCWI